MNTLNLSLMSNDNVQNLIGLDMNFVEISERINDLFMSMRTKEFDIESAINMIYYIIIESKLDLIIFDYSFLRSDQLGRVYKESSLTISELGQNDLYPNMNDIAKAIHIKSELSEIEEGSHVYHPDYPLSKIANSKTLADEIKEIIWAV